MRDNKDEQVKMQGYGGMKLRWGLGDQVEEELDHIRGSINILWHNPQIRNGADDFGFPQSIQEVNWIRRHCIVQVSLCFRSIFIIKIRNETIRVFFCPDEPRS